MSVCGAHGSAAHGVAAVRILYAEVLEQYATDVSRCRASCLRSYVRSRPLSAASSLRSRKTFAEAVRCRVACVEQYDALSKPEPLAVHVWRRLHELGGEHAQIQQLALRVLMTSTPSLSV